MPGAERATTISSQERHAKPDPVVVALRAQIAAQAELLRQQEAELVHSRKIFSRASEAARIGVWECSLPDETLTWTDVVYDMFDLPRGAPLDRKATLECYPAASRAELIRRRSRAIEDCGGFQLDAEIVTFAGRRRFIRITASVETEGGVPVRIFGMKQDITEEKLLADRTRYLAEFDVLTGLANRLRFQARLAASDEDEGGPIGTLMLVDLDGFKTVNDTFGHSCGDQCLRHVAQRLERACADADLLARIGGDEFAVLFGRKTDRVAVEQTAARIVAALGEPIRCCGITARIGASIGIAHEDAVADTDIFVRADFALYAAKAAGRSTFRSYEPEFESERQPRRLIMPGEAVPQLPGYVPAGVRPVP